MQLRNPIWITCAVVAFVASASPSSAQEDGESSMLRELVNGLYSPDEGMRERSLAALQGYGAEVIPAIAAKLESSEGTRPLGTVLRTAYERHLRSDAAVVAPRPTDEPPREGSAEDFLASRLRLARGLIRRQDYKGAKEILDAVVVLADDDPSRTLAVDLRRKVRQQIVRNTVLRGEIVTAGDRFALNEVIEVQLRLTNASSSPITIPAGDAEMPEGKGTLAVATVLYRIYDPLGNMRALATDHVVPLEDDIFLPPGGTWSMPFRIDPGEHHRSVQAVRTYTISADTQPLEIRSPGRDVFHRVSFPERTLTVFPLGWEQVGDDPIRYIRVFLEQSLLHELAVASWLVPRQDAPAAVGLLIQALEGAGGDVAMSLMSCLERISQESHGHEPSAWLHWWANVSGDWELDEEEP